MARNRSKKPLGLSFETLERREVFAGFTGGLSNGVLTINGTTAADNITLTQTADVVRLDGYHAAWSANSIKEIRINASGGNDTVRLAVSKQLAATFVGNGGSGSDVLYSTAQPKSLTGFEVGKLIAPPAGTEPVATPAITVVKQAAPNVMPGQTVVYDRWTYEWGLRDDTGYTMGPSQVYSTEAEARAAAQRHIDNTRGNGYWA